MVQVSIELDGEKPQVQSADQGKTSQQAIVQRQYQAGETVRGIAVLDLPEDLPLSHCTISFHCVGEVKWVEDYPKTPHYLAGVAFYDLYTFYEEVAKFSESGKSLFGDRLQANSRLYELPIYVRCKYHQREWTCASFNSICIFDPERVSSHFWLSFST